jgi:beta-mannosidase
MGWEDYSRLFDDLLPNVLMEEMPETCYWPSSPHSPKGNREHHLNPACGDSHLWGVWHERKPFEWYRTRHDRFCSEFGFQSFPQPSVIAEKTLYEDRNITSYIMEHFQRSGIGNSTIIHYMLDWFCLPSSFESTVWLSQILQGMAVKYGVEHWRRSMPRTMGTLYWQLNDMWMGPSWSSLDWKGNWKALHYMTKKFYAPLLISGVESVSPGERAVQGNSNSQQNVTIHITNDHRNAVTGTVRWTISDLHGRDLASDEFDVTTAERTSKDVMTLSVSKYVESHSSRNLLVWLELFVEGKLVSDNMVLLCRPKHLELERPAISVATESTDKENTHLVTLSTNVPALYVWLEVPGATDPATTSFEDNFFHLHPQRPYTMQVTCSDVSKLVVKSLANTFGSFSDQ